MIALSIRWAFEIQLVRIVQIIELENEQYDATKSNGEKSTLLTKQEFVCLLS